MSNSSMYVFHTKVSAKSTEFVMFYWLYKNTHRRALLFIVWIFLHKQKLSSIYRHKTYCNLMGLSETSRVAYNLGETQTCNIFFFLFKTYMYFSVAKISGEILASVCLEEENFQVLKRCYVQEYPTSFFFFFFFFCYGKAVNLLPMWNLDWSSGKFL